MDGMRIWIRDHKLAAWFIRLVFNLVTGFLWSLGLLLIGVATAWSAWRKSPMVINGGMILFLLFVAAFLAAITVVVPAVVDLWKGNNILDAPNGVLK